MITQQLPLWIQVYIYWCMCSGLSKQVSSDTWSNQGTCDLPSLLFTNGTMGLISIIAIRPSLVWFGHMEPVSTMLDRKNAMSFGWASGKNGTWL